MTSRTFEPWRLRCPQGHANVTRRSGKGRQLGSGEGWWYCGTCADARAGSRVSPRYDRVFDVKTGERV